MTVVLNFVVNKLFVRGSIEEEKDFDADHCYLQHPLQVTTACSRPIEYARTYVRTLPEELFYYTMHAYLFIKSRVFWGYFCHMYLKVIFYSTHMD